MRSTEPIIHRSSEETSRQARIIPTIALIDNGSIMRAVVVELVVVDVLVHVVEVVVDEVTCVTVINVRRVGT